MNLPNWVDTTLGVVGALGFVLAVFLAIIEFRRYRLPLHMKIRYYKVEYSDNQQSVVLFGLTFVNPASVGKTVNSVMYTRTFRTTDDTYNVQPDIIWQEPDAAYYDVNQSTVTFTLPNGECQMPYDEMLELPLDIPPHQSRSRWYCLTATLAKEPGDSFPIILQAYDILGKKLAEDRKYISRDDLKILGMHH